MNLIVERTNTSNKSNVRLKLTTIVYNNSYGRKSRLCNHLKCIQGEAGDTDAM